MSPHTTETAVLYGDRMVRMPSSGSHEFALWRTADWYDGGEERISRGDSRLNNMRGLVVTQ